MRKRFAMCLALAMAVSLTACGGTTEESTSNVTETSEEDVTRSEEETTEIAAEATTEEEEVPLAPIGVFSYEAEIGSHNITVEPISLDEPVYAEGASQTAAAYRDGKAYVAANNEITIYDVSENAGTVSKKVAYENIFQEMEVGTDGMMYINGGVFGATPVSEDGTVSDRVSATGELDISLDGSFGMTYYSGREAGTKVSVNGTSVDEIGEMTFSEISKIYCISAGDNEIVVGGYAEELEAPCIAVYDADGSLKYKVENVPKNNNYMDVCATESGVIAVTPGMIGFGDKDGNTYEIEASEFLDQTIWPFMAAEQEDGSVIIGGILYKTTNEVVFLRVTGF